MGAATQEPKLTNYELERKARVGTHRDRLGAKRICFLCALEAAKAAGRRR